MSVEQIPGTHAAQPLQKSYCHGFQRGQQSKHIQVIFLLDECNHRYHMQTCPYTAEYGQGPGVVVQVALEVLHRGC